jgi:hypothetical protein
MAFRNHHRVWTVLHEHGHYVVSCERCGYLGEGAEVYAGYIAAIHVGNHPS